MLNRSLLYRTTSDKPNTEIENEIVGGSQNLDYKKLVESVITVFTDIAKYRYVPYVLSISLVNCPNGCT